MLKSRVITHIEQINKNDWNACYQSDVENYDYLLAIEKANIEGFEISYIIIEDENGLCGCAPIFFTNYDLETSLDEPLKKIVLKLKSKFPWFLRVKLAAIGSSCTEDAKIGIKKGTEQDKVFQAIMHTFENIAKIKKAKLLAIKDLKISDAEAWNNGIKSSHFAKIAGMPIAFLPIDFTSIDEYFLKLSHATRKDMRRKLKSKNKLEILVTKSLKPYRHDFMALYEATLSRAQMTFEELPFEYFENILEQMPNNNICRLYFFNGKLLGANLLIHNHDELLDKYFIMLDEGKKHNLYFISWFDNIQYCLDYNIKNFIAGQASYENKLKLGCNLQNTFMAFKHTNPIFGAILNIASPFFSFSEE